MSEPTYKERMSSFLDGLQDFFINDERRAERQMYTSGRRQERRDNRQERRATRQAERAGRRDLALASEPRRMEQPQFKQDRQAIFDENVQALQETASRKANATGGEMKKEQDEENERIAMKDGGKGIEALREVAPEVVKRMGYQEGGEMEDQMNALAISVEPARVEEMPTEMEEQEMLPDEEMEEDYVDYVINSTLEEQDKEYLESALMKDAKLSEIFDQVIESATEFSGSGPIEGPGSEMSDSIPARLSDGEFVFTAKAVEEIGVDNLQQMMEDAETIADERQPVAYGGMIDEEDQAIPLPTQESKAAQGNVPNVVKQSRQVEEEMLKSSPRRYYVPVSG